mgnify:CR=1 FL=1
MEDIKQREGRPKRHTKNGSHRVNHHSRIKYTRMGNRTYKDNMKKTFKDFAEACWDTHKQVGFKTSSKTGKRVPNCVPKNEEGKDIPLSLYDLSELGPAAMKRRARMRARMGMLQKKYSDASKAGIHPSRVSQRHNKMTVKKGK